MSSSIWYVVHTKPRQELLAREHLLRQAYRVQLPLVRRIVRRKISLEPLFPRYVFFQLSSPQQALTPVRSTVGISSLVRFGPELAVLSDEKCRAIMAFSEAQQQGGIDALLQVEGVQVGQNVVIRTGAFAGLEGLVSSVAKDRVLVLMNLLGKEQTLGFEPTDIAAL